MLLQTRSPPGIGNTQAVGNGGWLGVHGESSAGASSVC
jgi:hypothetical protein